MSLPLPVTAVLKFTSPRSAFSVGQRGSAFFTRERWRARRRRAEVLEDVEAAIDRRDVRPLARSAKFGPGFAP